MFDAAAAVAAAATSFPARFQAEVDLQLLCSFSNAMKSYLLASSSLSSFKLITCGRCVPVETTRPSYADICAVEHSQVFHDLSRHGNSRSAVAMRRRRRMTTSEMKSFGTTFLRRTANSRSAKSRARLKLLATSAIACEQKPESQGRHSKERVRNVRGSLVEWQCPHLQHQWQY